MTIKTYNRFALLPLIILMLFLLFQPYLAPNTLKTSPLTSVDSVFTLPVDQGDDEKFELMGQVDFYPNLLLLPSDFMGSDESYLKVKDLIPFPSAWKNEKGIRYGTYHMILNGLTKGTPYAIHMMDGYTSFRVIVDGIDVASNGIVGKSRETSQPESKPMTGYFTPKNDHAEIIIQFSNYSADLNGIWQKTVIGEQEPIIDYVNHLNMRDMFILGALLLMAIYHWTLYLIMRRDKAVFFFAIFLTAVLIKTAFSGQQLGFRVYPIIHYDLGLRIAYFAIPIMVMSFLGYVAYTFKEVANFGVVKMGWIVSALEIGLILLLPQNIYQSYFLIYQLFIVVYCLIIVYWIIRAIKLNLQGSVIYLIGFLVCFAAAVNDILYSELFIHTGFYLGMGLFVLILAQSSIIAIRFNNAVLKEEALKGHLEDMVIQRTEQLENERNTFEHLSKVDSLTLVYNKRFLSEALSIEFEGFKRYKGLYSVVMLDIDFFKNINDNYGHLVGDEVLFQLAELLKSDTRKTDILGRFGGEEFLIILRFAEYNETIAHADKLRRNIEKHVFQTQAGELHITASFGVASVDVNDYDEQEVIFRADKALYQAKAQGKNKVC